MPFAGSICNRDVPAEMETDGCIIDVDTDFMDPQQCATIACDIYNHLRASEVIILFNLHPSELIMGVSPTLVNLVEDHGFISEEYYLNWYETFRGEAQSKVMRAYAQSGQYHTIVESRDF